MLISTLQKDLLTARKAREPIATGLLTALVGEAAMVGKNAGNRTSTDEEVLAVVRKFIKNAEETATRLDKMGTDSSVIRKEIEILTNYLPVQKTPDELRLIIKNIIAGSSSANMGVIMKELKDGWAGQYDAKLASGIVKEMLA